MTRFDYQALKADEIRLLQPLPLASNSLSFRIVCISLSSNPRYAALSYTWGPPGDVQNILLDGCNFRIRQNLYDALRQIESSKLVNQYLWVDAICINQGENAEALQERSIQITRMRQIYEQASKIVVWLGMPENETNNRLAVQLMEYLHEQFLRMQKKARPFRPWWWPRKARTIGHDIADYSQTVLATGDKKVLDVPGSETYRAWCGIISLCKSPWWTRTWVFQESTVPERVNNYLFSGVVLLQTSSKVRFLAGGQEFSWTEISTINVAANVTKSAPGLDSEFLVSSQNPVIRLAKFRSQRNIYGLPSFLDLLQMFRHTECHDPRDKVYAPLCLASDDVRRFITPDYASKTVLDVYTDVVQYCLAQPGYNLDFLGCTRYQQGTQEIETPQGVKSLLPSWVPNFSATLDIDPVPKVLYVPEKGLERSLRVYDRRSIPSRQGEMRNAYSPLGGTPSRSSIKDHTLCVSGVYVDTLKDIIQNHGPDIEMIRAVARDKSSQWARDMNYIYFTGESYNDAFRRTVVLDLVYDDLGRPSERGGKLELEFLRRPRHELNLDDQRRQRNIRSAQVHGSKLRDIALSQKGYLLMIPNTASVGDTIWALAGGQALYILRPMNSATQQYRFIGDSYAHGLMDGEIVRRLQVGDAHMQDLVLV